MNTQTCGSCKWFNPQPIELNIDGREYHECMVPLPFWLGPFNTHKDLGRGCRAYLADEPGTGEEPK